MELVTLDASFLGNLLTGKDTITAIEGKSITDQNFKCRLIL